MIIDIQELAPAEIGTLAYDPNDPHRAKVVVIINKAEVGSTAQSIRVFVDGSPLVDAFGNESWPVSTGREKRETAKNGDVYRTITPIGYFRPTLLKKLHVSKKWKADMPYSVFFIGGIAIHATNYLEALGKRASGGCVRMHPDNAKKLFELIKSTANADVTQIDRNGRDVVRKDGTPAKIKAYDTLIIVENQI